MQTRGRWQGMQANVRERCLLNRCHPLSCTSESLPPSLQFWALTWFPLAHVSPSSNPRPCASSMNAQEGSQSKIFNYSSLHRSSSQPSSQHSQVPIRFFQFSLTVFLFIFLTLQLHFWSPKKAPHVAVSALLTLSPSEHSSSSPYLPMSV